MNFLFMMNTVLSRLEERRKSHISSNPLVHGFIDKPLPTAEAQHAFKLDISGLRLINFNKDSGIEALTDLITQQAGYHLRMETIVDQALMERHENARVKKAIFSAFEKTKLPYTIIDTEEHPDETIGSLHHPHLANLSKQELVMLYVAIHRALGYAPDYNFNRAVIGKKESAFLQNYDGIVINDDAYISATVLLEKALRADHITSYDIEFYSRKGEDEAKAMKITHTHDCLWAWLEAEAYQYRRCLDIQKALQFMDLVPAAPEWIRQDIFCLYQKESLKKKLSTILQTDHLEWQDYTAEVPALRSAILLNMAGQGSPHIQKLLTVLQENASSPIDENSPVLSTTEQKQTCKDEISAFCHVAQERQQSARKIGLL